MTTVLQGDVKVPGIGKTKKVWIYGGLGIAGAYVGWRWYQSSRATAPMDDGLYSTTDQSEMGRSTTGGPYNAGGNTGSTTTDGTAPDAIDTNAEWTQKAVERLSGAGFDPAVVYAALGEFLARRALDKSEATIARSAIAAAGEPPVGRPWSVIEEGSTGTGTLPAPSGVAAIKTGADSVRVTWNSVPGASSYKIYRNGSEIAFATGTTFDLSRASAGVHRFSVAAVGSTGKVGPRSEESTVTLVTAGKPAPPAQTSNPPPSAPSSRVPPYTEVIAVSGDSISKIAARYGKSWETVWNFNLQYRSAATVALLKLRGKDKIFSGTRIWVPK